ncbi:hypothetical protein PG999_013505 [Apiospora kogelbergensis]|uniref:Uncharacterized protein n=1 Tax=Apiospora kogelbergensis TaxID=1337665 RepID=A0AAW0Q5J9_9PEZI
MPHIGSVMERSLVPERSTGEALLNLVARSVAAGFMKRDAISDAKGQVMDVKTAFSSWDNCMQACCGNCCGCCDSPQKKNKYLDDPFIPPHHAENQAYRSQAPMFAPTMAPTMAPTAAPSFAAKSEPPQYAEFDMGKKGGGDELPQMPSWDGASSKKVLIEEDAVELEPMKKPDTMQNASLMAAGGVSRGVSPNGVSPAGGNSPYGPPSQAGPNGYMGAARPENNMYGMNGNASGQVYNDGFNNGSYGQVSRENMNQGYRNQPYSDPSGGQGYDQGYGMPAAGAVAVASAMGQGYNNNGGYGHEQMNQGMNQGYPQSRTPRPYDDYSRSITPSNAAYGNAPPPRGPTPQGNGPYGGSPNRMRTPAPQQQGGDGYNDPRGYNQGGYGGPDPRMRASPAPQQQQQSGYGQNGGYGGYGARSQTPNGYGRQPQQQPGPRRQNTYDVTPQTARAPPQRSYTDVPPPVSPIQNAGGFDFSSGYSRSDDSASPQPPQAANGGKAYPGYRTYKPAV